MSSPKRILIMCLNDPSGDPRPRRFIDLSNQMGFLVSLASYKPVKEKIEYEDFFLIEQKPKGKLKNLIRHILLVYSVMLRLIGANDCYLTNLSNKRFYLDRLIERLKGARFDLIIVEDLQLMPVVSEIKNEAPVIFDVREYYPRQREDSLFFRIVEKPERTRLCKLYLKQCDLLFTVSEGLAKEYKREFGVEMNVLLSVPKYRSLDVKMSIEDTIKLVHHGVANYNRKIENMIKVVKKLDSRFTLDFYLTGDAQYIYFLKNIADNDPRIKFNDPVPFSQLINTISVYDVGFFYVEPTTFNLEHCLPNKFFEYIQARLMLAIGPSPDMSSIVRKYKCGVIADEFSIESMVESLQKLKKDEVNAMKYNSNKASEELSFETESKKIIQAFDSLIAVTKVFVHDHDN